MQEEIDYRVNVLRPKLIEEVQTTRAFGDLSENFEYKTAKQLKNKNESRIRYLERMIKTAKVITDKSSPVRQGCLTGWSFILKKMMKLRKSGLLPRSGKIPLSG
jgi:transcription elongation factor GreA